MRQAQLDLEESTIFAEKASIVVYKIILQMQE